MSNELDLRIREAMQRVVDESPPPPDIPDFPRTITTTRPRIPGWVAAVASAAVVLILIGGTSLLIDADDGVVGETAAPPTIVASTPSTTPAAAAPATDAGQTASVTVSGVAGHPGDHLAGVLYAGNELTDLDRDALGGFWTTIPNDEAATTNVIRQPADAELGIFPFVSDEALILNPGFYTLVIWIDDALNPVTRWVPLNSDGMGLYGCQTVFEVTNAEQADIAIAPHLQPDGWNASCTTGVAMPGTDAAAAVAPDDMWMPELEMSMPPVVGEGDGQTVHITVSGVKGREGDELAVVLYEGGELHDLDRDAVGGFWTVISGDDFTTTGVVRQPGVPGMGRFPFVSDEALTVEPGTYTLVVWVDEALGSVSRWVPINSYREGDVVIEGTDLFGCHAVFEVGDEDQSDVAVEAVLHHNGWNVDCTTGVAIPGTDAAAAVAPDDMWMPEWEMSMPPVVRVGDGQTASVTVSGVKNHVGQHLAGVLYEGGTLTDIGREALGGFWTTVPDDATTTEVVREPGDNRVGRFPFVSDQALILDPGTYTLVIWVDFDLNPVSRWVPINTDGRGLFGCQTTFEVTDDAQTVVAVAPDLQPDGWHISCGGQ